MSEQAKGVAAIVIACIVWGTSGMYYKLLSNVPPLEVLCHRSLWTFVFFGVFLALRSRLGEVWRALSSRRLIGALVLSSIMISTNWFFFIFSIQSGWAVEASLGYYIFPLVAVLLGAVVLRERFNRMQGVAIVLAVAAVTILTVGMGVAPWISLVLAITFGIYGLVKSRLAVAPMPSVFIEVMLLSPIAVVWLFGAHFVGWTAFDGRAGGIFGSTLGDSLLLAASGLITGTPLVLMSYATKRISLATVGIVQYVNPTIQFAVAAFVFGEAVTIWHMIAFPIIWIGLTIYSVDGWGRERSRRRAASRSSTVATG